jgi:hypothetical protein
MQVLNTFAFVGLYEIVFWSVSNLNVSSSCLVGLGFTKVMQNHYF